MTGGSSFYGRARGNKSQRSQCSVRTLVRRSHSSIAPLCFRVISDVLKVEQRCCWYLDLFTVKAFFFIVSDNNGWTLIQLRLDCYITEIYLM